MLKAEDTTADFNGADFYLVHPGDVFNAENIKAGKFPYLIYSKREGGWEWSPGVQIDLQNDLYLGVNTGNSHSSGTLPAPARDAFGWVQLVWQDGMLMPGQSVIAYDTQGIIVGTQMVVPEPGTWLLAALAIAVVCRRTIIGYRVRPCPNEATSAWRLTS